MFEIYCADILVEIRCSILSVEYLYEVAPSLFANPGVNFCVNRIIYWFCKVKAEVSL